MARSIGRPRRGTLLLTLSVSLAAFESAAPAQGTLRYYFAHIASAGVWRTTFTYVNQTSLPVTCNTSFYSDTGSPLPLSFSGASLSSTSDTIPVGGTVRRQTDAQAIQPVVSGWAAANCTGPVKASALFRLRTPQDARQPNVQWSTETLRVSRRKGGEVAGLD